jgi:hypothetical protein
MNHSGKIAPSLPLHLSTFVGDDSKNTDAFKNQHGFCGNKLYYLFLVLMFFSSKSSLLMLLQETTETS